MWPDLVSHPGPLTYKSGALPAALCGVKELKQYIDEMITSQCFTILV